MLYEKIVGWVIGILVIVLFSIVVEANTIVGKDRYKYSATKLQKDRQKNTVPPKLIAQGGGQGNFPKNSMFAFLESKKIGVDYIALDVQVSSDGELIVYGGTGLSEETEAKGVVKYLKSKELQKIRIKCSITVECPKDKSLLYLVTLKDVLKRLPDTKFIVQMKSLPEETLVDALMEHLTEEEWRRLVFYSTNPQHIDILKQMKPEAITFEGSDVTRGRILHYLLAKNCGSYVDKEEKWIAFELDRHAEVIEKFKLRQDSKQDTTDVVAWTPETLACTKKKMPFAKVVFFGINNQDAYNQARELGIYGVFTDFPKDITK